MTTPPEKPDLNGRPPTWWPRTINVPRTTTILAIGFLGGNLLFMPMIAFLGQFIEPEYAESVMLVASLFKDGMLLILGYYFGRSNRGSGEGDV